MIDEREWREMGERGRAALAAAAAALGPEIHEVVLEAARRLPPEVRDWPAPRLIQFTRLRLDLRQIDLARASGMAQSQVSRLEAQEDCLLSTWRKAYAAMGFRLLLVPYADTPFQAIVEDARKLIPDDRSRKSLRPHGPWFRRREGAVGRLTDRSIDRLARPPYP